MNEVESWSSRAGRVVGVAGDRLGRAWTWFTDLGQGAWMLAVGSAVVIAIAVGIVEGRHDPGGTPCSSANPYVERMQSLSQEPHHRLDAGDVAFLHTASTRLTTIAGQAFGDDVAAIQLAARTAAEAEPGHRMHADAMTARFDSACGFGGGAEPGFGSR